MNSKRLLPILLILMASCTNEPDIVKPSSTINEVINNGGELPLPASSERIEIESKSESQNENGVAYISQSKKVKLSKQFDAIVALNTANANILYPGALIQGGSLLNSNKLQPLGDFPREPITISINDVSKKVNNPNGSASVNAAIKELLKTASPTPAQMIYNVSALYDKQQAFMELGMNANWLAGEIESKFQRENSISRNSVLLYFKQIYYTASVNDPTSPADYFAPTVNVSDLQNKVSPGNPLCYISTVNYGRIIIVKVTSSEKSQKMKSSLAGSYLTVGGKIELDESKLSGDYDFSALVLGGSAQGAATAVTGNSIEEINNLIKNEANYSPSNPGFPVSYTVKYLQNNRDVMLGTTQEYWERNWEVDPNSQQKIDVILSHFDIIEDCNTFVDGKFYYTIEVLDKNGNILGEHTREKFEAIEKTDGERIDLAYQIQNIVLSKTAGNSFTVHITLWDSFDSGNDTEVGKSGMKYTYNNGWKFDTDWQTLDLGSGSCHAQFTYRIDPK